MELGAEAENAASAAAQRSAWTIPLGVGALPEDLIEMAQATLRAQHAAIATLENMRDGVGRQLMALRTVDLERPPARSVYLDVVG